MLASDEQFATYFRGEVGSLGNDPGPGLGPSAA